MGVQSTTQSAHQLSSVGRRVNLVQGIFRHCDFVSQVSTQAAERCLVELGIDAEAVGEPRHCG